MNKTEINQALLQHYQSFIHFIQSLSEAEFTTAAAEKWTAGQQLDHLVKAVKPLLTAFGLPTFLPRLLFGKANRPSRSYAEVVTRYTDKLKAGAKASGKFIPPAKIPFSQKEELLKNLKTNVERLTVKVSAFKEEKLDSLIAPHPLLGKMTFRELLYFTIYHVEHHQQSLVKMLGK